MEWPLARINNLSNTLALFEYKLLNLDIKTFQAISLGKKKLKRPQSEYLESDLPVKRSFKDDVRLFAVSS